MAINPNVDFVSGAILTAAQQNRFPRGIMAKSSLPGNFALSTTLTDFGLSLSFTAVANRYYKYTFYAYASNSSVSTTLETYITDSSNNVKGSLNVTASSTGFFFQHLTYISTETAGTVIRKLRGRVGTGVGTVYGPLDFWVEDIGPA